MNFYEYEGKVSEEARKLRFRVKRNITISLAGALFGASISMYSINPMINESKTRIASSSYETSQEKLKEIYKDVSKLYNFCFILTKASILYLIPGICIPPIRYRRRKKSLEKELEVD
jgi:hypothetical protein